MKEFLKELDWAFIIGWLIEIAFLLILFFLHNYLDNFQLPMLIIITIFYSVFLIIFTGFSIS